MGLNLNRNRIWASLNFGGNRSKLNEKHLVLVFLPVFLYFAVFSALSISFRKSRCMLLFEALSPIISHRQFYNFRVCSKKPKVQRIILTLQTNEGLLFLHREMMISWDLHCPKLVFSTIFLFAFLLFVCLSQIFHCGTWNPYIHLHVLWDDCWEENSCLWSRCLRWHLW